MKPKEAQLLRTHRLEEAQVQLETTTQQQTEAQKDQALLMLGSIQTMGNLAQFLRANTLRALDSFKELKGHEALGYARFDDFMNKSPYSPMPYKKFNEQYNLLMAEGDEIFDLLTESKIPVTGRKMLPAGVCKVEGDELVIGEDRFHKSQVDLIAYKIKEMQRQLRTQSETIEKGKDQVQRLRKTVEEEQHKNYSLEKSLETARNNQVRTVEFADIAFDPLEEALAKIDLSVREAERAIAELTPDERAEKRDEFLRTWSNCRNRLDYAWGTITREQFVKLEMMNSGPSIEDDDDELN